MKKPEVIDKRQIRLEEILKDDYIPFLGGRPKRKIVIQRDDVLNLQIFLNTTNSVDELIQKV